MLNKENSLWSSVSSLWISVYQLLIKFHRGIAEFRRGLLLHPPLNFPANSFLIIKLIIIVIVINPIKVLITCTNSCHSVWNAPCAGVHLMDQEQLIGHVPGIHLNIEMSWPERRYLAKSIYGSYNYKSTIDLPRDEIAVFHCPECHEQITSKTECWLRGSDGLFYLDYGRESQHLLP